MLPKLACPACWPAYAGLLSSVGLGFLLATAYLLPLTAAFLLIALLALGYQARQRRRYGPFALGTAAAAILLLGKFLFDFEPSLYGGVALLVGASLWNSWPKRRPPNAACPACVTP